MTYKSFTTLDEFFDLLTARFRIQPPANLTPSEREEWGKLKQHVIQIRSVLFLTCHKLVTDSFVCLQGSEHFQGDGSRWRCSREGRPVYP
jgi:hypothetical protein